MEPSNEKPPYWIRFEGSKRWVAIPKVAMLEMLEVYWSKAMKDRILKQLQEGGEIKVYGGYISTYETITASSPKTKVP